MFLQLLYVTFDPKVCAEPFMCLFIFFFSSTLASHFTFKNIATKILIRYFERSYEIFFEDTLINQKMYDFVTGTSRHATPRFTLFHHTYHEVLPSGGFLF